LDHRRQRKENTREEQKKEKEPVLAPGMHTSDPLEEKATPEEIERGDYTEVTRLFLDRTPED
jgi:hypothetical protein